MKRLFAFALLIVVTLSTITASASEPNKTVIDLGDGFYMVETSSSYSLSRSSNIIYGNKSGNIYQDSTLIGVTTLYASFDISSSTAKATTSDITGTGYNGGIYTNGTSNCSRNTVSGTAYFSYNGFEKTGRLSISCSPDGTLY
jgi:hypothetical protein